MSQKNLFDCQNKYCWASQSVLKLWEEKQKHECIGELCGDYDRILKSIQNCS